MMNDEWKMMKIKNENLRCIKNYQTQLFCIKIENTYFKMLLKGFLIL